MEIILLEKIRNLGAIGSKIDVNSGYARNFLIPQGKAVRATKENLERIEKSRSQLEQKEKELLEKALERKTAIENFGLITVPAKASDEGKLFGSIGTRDIAYAITAAGIAVTKSEINLPQGPIRLIGEHEIGLHLHTDVITTAKIKVVPSE